MRFKPVDGFDGTGFGAGAHDRHSWMGSESSDERREIADMPGTIATKDRFGLVMVQGEPYQIVNIGMRMLTPRELFAAQRFPADYVIDPIGPSEKSLPKTAEIRIRGSSICPPLAVSVRANYPQPIAADRSVTAAVASGVARHCADSKVANRSGDLTKTNHEYRYVCHNNCNNGAHCHRPISAKSKGVCCLKMAP